jgi:Ca-activated chloride channel family protein
VFNLFLDHLLQLACQEEQDNGCSSAHEDKQHEEIKQILHLISEEAMQAYEQAVKVETNKGRLASIYHNMGVILQSQKQFGPAIECYKNALRRNPADNESRYNLVLCQHQLKNNPQQDQQNDNKENKDGKDKNKEEDKNSSKKDKQENKDKKEDQQKQQQKQSQQNEENMSKENAEQLLNAAMQDEKDTQERIRKAMAKPRQRKLEKQW